MRISDWSSDVCSSDLKTSSKAPTWTVGLDWQANRDLFLYVVTRRGYRSGGINGPTLAGRLPQFQSFAPEKVTDIEFGIRSDFQAGDVKIKIGSASGRERECQYV